jgi:hypothetical protein
VRYLIILLALFGCQPEKEPWEFPTAQNGVRWDDRCRKDLSHITTPVFRLPRAKLVEMHPPRMGYTINGIYSPILKSIFIANDLTGWQYKDTLHWERCRAYLHETTGSPLFDHERK